MRVEVDAVNDLALIKVEVRVPFSPLCLARGEQIPGAPVIVISNPQGLDRSVSAGLLAGVRDIGGRRLLQQGWH
jgi:S1-C subfamily serine protease